MSQTCIRGTYRILGNEHLTKVPRTDYTTAKMGGMIQAGSVKVAKWLIWKLPLYKVGILVFSFYPCRTNGPLSGYGTLAHLHNNTSFYFYTLVTELLWVVLVE